MKSPNKDYIHDPTFRHSGLVSSSGVVWCWMCFLISRMCFLHVFSDQSEREPRIAFRLIRKHMLYTLYHAVIARKYIWVKQNASFAHVWKNIKGLFLILTAQNQLWLSTCVKQAITLHGKILESLPLTIVMVKGFVWKPGISMRALVP